MNLINKTQYACALLIATSSISASLNLPVILNSSYTGSGIYMGIGADVTTPGVVCYAEQTENEIIQGLNIFPVMVKIESAEAIADTNILSSSLSKTIEDTFLGDTRANVCASLSNTIPNYLVQFLSEPKITNTIGGDCVINTLEFTLYACHTG